MTDQARLSSREAGPGALLDDGFGKTADESLKSNAQANRKNGAALFGFLACCFFVATLFLALVSAGELQQAISSPTISAVQEAAEASVALATVVIPYVVARCLYAFHRMLKS